MPLNPKGRAEMLAKFNAMRKKSRKPGFDGEAIILGTKGGLTRKEILQVEERLRKKRELNLKTKIPYIQSPDNVMLIKGAKVSATELATRLSLNYLTKPLGITKAQKEFLKNILLHRAQKIKGTNISLRPSLELKLIEFANLFGENGQKKAELIAHKLTTRAKNLRKMAGKSKTKSDMFYNVTSTVGGLETYLSAYPPAEFAQHVIASIRERSLELNELKQTNISGKERYVNLLENQIKQAKKNYILFRQNNL